MGDGTIIDTSLFDDNFTYAQVNLLYGREFKLSKGVYAEVHTGTGLIYINEFKSGGLFSGLPSTTTTLNTIGFPIIGKLRFHTGPRFSIGIQLGLNVNSVGTISTGGVFVQWNRSK